jgi:gliding motility-associated-like protein
MPKSLTLLFFLSIGFSVVLGQEAGVRFEENKGQWSQVVRFRADVPSGACFIEQHGITWNFHNQEKHQHGHSHQGHEEHDAHEKAISGHAFKMRFLNALPSTRVEGEQPRKGYSNYYLGSDSRHWASQVKAYGTVSWKQLYPGISVRMYSNANGLKYDFLVDPEANPKQIAMAYDGLSKLDLKKGELHLVTSVGTLVEQAPVAWQEIDGKRYPVNCEFSLEQQKVRFNLGKYDSKHPLVIDPQLVFGSFTGSSADNWGFTATYDQAGNTYSAGVVFGLGFPVTPGAWQNTYIGGDGSRPCDIGIMKFSQTGERMFATYLGGAGNELPQSLIVSTSNELFVFGTTGSSDFPTTASAYSRSFKGGNQVSILRNGITFDSGTDLFISRFSDSGNTLLASTLIGGTSNDGLNVASQLRYNYADEARGGIAIDINNNVIIGCSTTSPDFPVPGNGFQSQYGGGSQDGMLAKFNENLSSLLWGSFMGGSAADGIFALSIDRNTKVYVAGGTVSLDFPMEGDSYQPSNGGGQSDGFIATVSANGQQLLASTYYGADVYDQIYLLALDRMNNIYVFGQTEKGGDFYQNGFTFAEPNGKQFISRFSNSLDSRIWSTSFGRGAAKPDISPTAFTVDICGQIFLAGWGGSSNASPDGNQFGGTNGLTVSDTAFQTTTDNNDFYLLVLNEADQELVYASFFGGPTSSEHVDGGTSRFDRRGVMHQAVCAGCGGRDDFPTTPGVWSNTNGSSSGCNNAVFKFDFQLPATVAAFTSETIGCAPFDVAFSNTSNNALEYRWFINGSQVSTDENPNYSFNTPGLYQVQLIAENENSCNVVDTFYKLIRVVNSTFDVFDSLEVCLLDKINIGPTFPIDPYYQPQWTPTTGLDRPNEQFTPASPPENTNYILLLSLANCADTISQFVRVLTDSVYAGPDLNICRGQEVEIGLPANTIDYTYSWSPATPLNNATLPNPLAAVDESTVFAVLRIPVDSTNGCPGRDSLQVYIPSGAPLAKLETEVIAGCTEVRLAITNLSELAETFSWDFNNGSGDTTALNPTITYPYGDTLLMTLIVSNPVCADTLDFKQPLEDLEFYYTVNNSNAFSPNGDGLNDCFSPALRNLPPPDDKNFIPCSSLIIYDRWGKKIWERNEQPDGCWDGLSDTGVEMPEGTYFYLFEGRGKKQEGTVSLQR